MEANSYSTVFIELLIKLEIKDDKDIDKRNLNEIKYSFVKVFLRSTHMKKLINKKSSEFIKVYN